MPNRPDYGFGNNDMDTNRGRYGGGMNFSNNPNVSAGLMNSNTPNMQGNYPSISKSNVQYPDQQGIELPNVNPKIDLGGAKTKTLMTAPSIDQVSPSPTNMKMPVSKSIFEDTKDRKFDTF